MAEVSCICPTFGRPECLEEAIESFLRQDYEGTCELIVLNDAEWMPLHGDFDRVTIYNMDRRAPDMGSKWNMLVDLARYDILIPWPDDDIMLPWSITTFVRILGNRPYVYPRGRHTATAKRYGSYKPIAGAQGIIAFTRKAWHAVGGYPHMYGGQDKGFLGRLRKKFGRQRDILPHDEAFFIYRWAGIPFHLSGKKSKEKWDMLGDKIRAKTLHGTYDINPQWRQDYVAMVKDTQYA